MHTCRTRSIVFVKWRQCASHLVHPIGMRTVPVLPPAESLCVYRPPDMSGHVLGRFLFALKIAISHVSIWTSGPPKSASRTTSRSVQAFSRAHDRDRQIYRPRCRPSMSIGRIYRPTAYVVLRCSLLILDRMHNIYYAVVTTRRRSIHGSFDECNWVTVSNLRRSQTTYTLTLYSDFAHLVMVRSAKSFK